MDFYSLKNIQTLLVQHGVHPQKSLGQNFLVSKGSADKLLATAELNNKDTVLEIGPGIGTITQELAQTVQKVIAVEKDHAMVTILQETLANYTNIEIIENDILNLERLSFPQLSFAKFGYKVVANLPYYITAPTIRTFLETKQQPASLTLMVQKEVGQRICAKPPDMSILAVSVQVYATTQLKGYVKKGAFWPMPKVDSAIVHIVPTTQSIPKEFFKVVKTGFAQPRKQLQNNLKGLGLSKEDMLSWLEKNNVDPKQRPETLTVQDWTNLTTSFHL